MKYWGLSIKLRLDASRAAGDVRAQADAAMRTTFLGTNIVPLQDRDELVRFLELIRDQRPRNVLEIGTAKGGTLFLLCQNAAPDGTIVSVDLPGGRFGGGYPEDRSRLYQSFAQRGQHLLLIRGDSHSASVGDSVQTAFGEEPIDLLFIDGDHTYEGVQCDYGTYAPLVRPGGMICFHDIRPGDPELGGGVPRFWQEISGSARSVEILSQSRTANFGIGIIRKGSE